MDTFTIGQRVPGIELLNQESDYRFSVPYKLSAIERQRFLKTFELTNNFSCAGRVVSWTCSVKYVPNKVFLREIQNTQRDFLDESDHYMRAVVLVVTRQHRYSVDALQASVIHQSFRDHLDVMLHYKRTLRLRM